MIKSMNQCTTLVRCCKGKRVVYTGSVAGLNLDALFSQNKGGVRYMEYYPCYDRSQGVKIYWREIV